MGHFESVLLSQVHDDAPVPLPVVSELVNVSQVVDPAWSSRRCAGSTARTGTSTTRGSSSVPSAASTWCSRRRCWWSGLRPPLGVIVLDDGAVFQLDSDYLLGRDPASDERVRSEEVRGMPIKDQSNQISRVHARLELRGWDAVLIDNESTNGTFMNLPKTADWHQLTSGGEHVLIQGTRVRIGHRTLAFNTHAGASS